MKQLILFFLIIFFIPKDAFSQAKTNWYGYVDAKTELIGFKDFEGNVKVEPKFHSFTNTGVFKNIVAVMEKKDLVNGDDFESENYYLLKNGSKVGKDSLYINDYYLDSEKEEKIRFQDPLTQKVGFFDANGKVTIPAIYSDAHPFSNGFAKVLKDATKMCENGLPFSKDNLCEHPGWKGGETLIINSKNETVFEKANQLDFQHINWYTLQINPKKVPVFYKTFKTITGDSYAFLDLEAEFKNWFFTKFIYLKTQTDFQKNSLSNIIIAKESAFKIENINDPEFEQWAWVKENTQTFMKNNFTIFEGLMNDLKQNEKTDKISFYATEPLFFEYSDEKELFPTDLENPAEQFPYFEVSYYDNLFRPKFSMGFLKTKDGYKLQSISY